MNGSVFSQNLLGSSALSTASRQSAGATSKGAGALSFADMLQDGVRSANSARPRQGRDPSGGARSRDSGAPAGPQAAHKQDLSRGDQASATSSGRDTREASSPSTETTQDGAGGAKHTPDGSQEREGKGAVAGAGKGQDQVSDPQSGGQSVADSGNDSPQTSEERQDIAATDAGPTATGPDGNGPRSPGALPAEDPEAGKTEKGDPQRRKSSRRDGESAVAGVSATAAATQAPGQAAWVAPAGGAGPAARGSGTQGAQQLGAAVPGGESRTGGLPMEEESGPSQGSLEQATRAMKEPANSPSQGSLEQAARATKNPANSPPQGSVEQAAQATKDSTNGPSGRGVGANGVSAQSTAGAAATASPASASSADASSAAAQAAGPRHFADAVQPASPGGLSKPDGVSHHAGADSPVPTSAGTSTLSQLAGAGQGTPDGSQAPIDPTLAGATLGATGATSHPALVSPFASGAYHTSLSLNASSWPNDLGSQVIWMVGAQMSRADLTLNPPELGKMEIHVSLADDKTKVSFNVHNGVAREAVTGTLPRLRELFQQAGINLQHVDVTEHQSGSNQGGAGSQSGQAGTGGGQGQSGASIRIQSLPSLSARPLPDNMIDAYA